MIMKSAYILLPLAALMIGCGGNGNPAKDINDAREEQIEANREEREERAEQKQEHAEERAEQRYNQAEEQHAKLPSADQNVANAEAKMIEQRSIYQSEATAKLEKANARIAAAKAKLDKARAAPLEARNQLEVAVTQRDSTKTAIDNLRNVSNEQWKDATEQVNKSLDQLESLVARVEESASKL